jgi:uncharacterized Zn-binding protein involved in type VI secretion
MGLAARIGDMHVCPQVTSRAPHVGGPIVSGATTVLIGGRAAATVGSTAVCAGPTDVVITGSPVVLIEGKQAARMGDMTEHGGFVLLGSPTVLIGP